MLGSSTNHFSLVTHHRVEARTDLYLPRRSGVRGTWASSLALLNKLRECPILLGQLSDAAIVVVKPADRMVDQPGAEHDQAQVQEQQRHEQRHHLPDAVIARGRDEHAQDREGQSEDGNPSAQGRQRSSFLGEENLDFPKDEIVQLG